MGRACVRAHPTIRSAGCIYCPINLDASAPKHEFLDLGRPIDGCEMRIVDPEDGVTRRADGESGELQVRGPMLFVRYYNNPTATSAQPQPVVSDPVLVSE